MQDPDYKAQSFLINIEIYKCLKCFEIHYKYMLKPYQFMAWYLSNLNIYIHPVN